MCDQNTSVDSTCYDGESGDLQESMETASEVANKQHTALTKQCGALNKVTHSMFESQHKDLEEAHIETESESVDDPDGISKFFKSLLCGTVKPKNVKENEESYQPKVKQTEENSLQTELLYQENTYVHKASIPKLIPNITDAGNQYAFSYPVRGYMVIIVNETFKHQTTRKGSDLDWQYLHQLARKLGFIVYNKHDTHNVSRSQTLKILLEMSRADHSGCDMFMFAISTHGMMQPNPRAKGQTDHALICADDKMIFTSSITQIFNDENCPSLKNKPKIFLIQACRGEGSDSGSDVTILCPSVKVHKTQRQFLGNAQCAGDGSQQIKDDSDAMGKSDSETTSSRNVFTGTNYGARPNSFVNLRAIRQPHKTEPKETPYPVVDTPSLRCDNDQLVFYAIPQGQMAWRSEGDGSWMLYYLHTILNGRGCGQPLNLLKTLTKVSAQMSMRTSNSPSNLKLHEKKAVSIIEHKLTRDIIFTPKQYHTQHEHIGKYRQWAI